jgi:hypothetical protein
LLDAHAQEGRGRTPHVLRGHCTLEGGAAFQVHVTPRVEEVEEAEEEVEEAEEEVEEGTG